jgi:gliding motility-associated-like protein
MAITVRTIACLIFLVGLIGSPASYAQNQQAFSRHGNMIKAADCSMVEFKSSAQQQPNGSILVAGNAAAWYHKPLDLSKPFDLGFILNADNLEAPGYQNFVDGWSLTFKSAGAGTLGTADSGIGFGGLKPSVSVVFDMKYNLGQSEPNYPHLSIQSAGVTHHNAPTNLSSNYNLTSHIKNLTQPGSPFPPLYAFTAFCKVSWSPVSKRLSVFMDGTEVIRLTDDIVQKIFSGNPLVEWGFTASQTAFLPADPGGSSEVRLPSIRMYFGKVAPAFTTQPRLDTCFTNSIQFFDQSHYDLDSLVNSRLLAKWYWDFGNGQTSTLQNPGPQTYPAPGKYLVQFAVTNQIGCTVDTLRRTVILGSKPVADFEVRDGCVGDTLIISDKSTSQWGDVSFWHWQSANDVFASKSIKLAFTQPGQKVLSLAVRTHIGCTSDTVRKSFAIHAKPSADFSMVKDCNGGVYFSASSPDSSSIQRWRWLMGDGAQIFGQQQYYFFDPDGLYLNKLVVVSRIGCVSDTVAKPVSIHRVFAFAGNDTVISQDQVLLLNGKASSNQVHWWPGAGLNNPNLVRPEARLQSDAVYVLQVTNPDGCEATDTVKVKVYNRTGVLLPNAFTPNSDGLNDYFRLLVPGLKTLQGFQIFNRWGQRVFSSVSADAAWDGQIGGKPASVGTYVWVVRYVDHLGTSRLEKGTVTLIR